MVAFKLFRYKKTTPFFHEFSEKERSKETLIVNRFLLN